MKFKIICLFLLALISIDCVGKQLDGDIRKSEQHLVKKKIIKRKVISHKTIHREPMLTDNMGINKDSVMRYYLFVPLVGFIFLLTIVSVIGFFVMMFNSKGLFDSTTEGSFTNSVIRNNLTKDEYLEVVKLKQIIKERMRSNYKAAPGTTL